MLKIIKEDLYRYVGKQYSIKMLLKGFRSQGFRYMFFRRIKDNYGVNHIVGFVASLLLRRYTYKYGFQIGGRIGGGFFIGHFGTIVVSSLAVIGKNCNIAHGVTIGATRRGPDKGAPIIGDTVWIGTNAVLVGKIIVGNNVLIAPGAFVNFNVPSNSVVIGNPGKIIPKPLATEGYVNNKIS